MISKELLTAIRNDELTVNEIDYDLEYYQIGYLLSNNQWYFINIYELAYKCKQWAFLKWFDIESSVDVNEINENDEIKWMGYAFLSDMKNIEHINNRNNYIKEFNGNSEPEAIFKACEWILKQKDIKW